MLKYSSKQLSFHVSYCKQIEVESFTNFNSLFINLMSYDSINNNEKYYSIFST